MPWEKMLELKRFVLIPIDDDPDRVQRRFPDFKVQRLRHNWYELARR
jgi:hypothetical protein